jgi:hypothetical protein
MLLLFLIWLMKQTNVEKLSAEGLVDDADLTATDKKLINDLSDDEIGAIISAGKKVLSGTKAGEKVAKVAV